MNEAGREFLAFLATNEATICNTWFKKKKIRKYTWQHPRSKVWHCIDYAVVRQKNRRMCLDANVMRGAECHTEHKLLQVKLRIRQVNRSHKPLQKGKKFNVGLLRPRDGAALSPREMSQDREEREWQLICHEAMEG